MYGVAHIRRYICFSIIELLTRERRILFALLLCHARNEPSRSESTTSHWASKPTRSPTAAGWFASVDHEEANIQALPMSLFYDSERQWRHMATVEIVGDVPDFVRLVQDDTLKFQVVPAGKSPPGFQWFLLFMDFSTGYRRAARTAWAVLTALRKSSDAGWLSGFRVISGAQWLALEATHSAEEAPVIGRSFTPVPTQGAASCAS